MTAIPNTVMAEKLLQVFPDFKPKPEEIEITKDNLFTSGGLTNMDSPSQDPSPQQLSAKTPIGEFKIVLTYEQQKELFETQIKYQKQCIREKSWATVGNMALTFVAIATGVSILYPVFKGNAVTSAPSSTT